MTADIHSGPSMSENITESGSPNSDMVVSDRPAASAETAPEQGLTASAAAMSNAAAMMPWMYSYMGMGFNPYMQFSTEQLLALTQMYSGMVGYNPYSMPSMLLSQQSLTNTDKRAEESPASETEKQSSSSSRVKEEPQTTFKQPRSISPPLKKAILQRYNGMVYH